MFCRLGDVLSRRVVEVIDRSDLRCVPIIEKISFGGVISVTEPDEREDYRGRLFWAEMGDLIYSKIRAKQGSLGLISPEVGRLAVSAEYPVYTPIASKVIPDYLTLLLKCPSFLRFLDGIASGGDTKTRISPELFESLRVALPPLPTQRAIVAHWQATQEKNAVALKAADDHEAELVRVFMRSLGLVSASAGITARGFSLRWSEIARWGVEQARRRSQPAELENGKYPVVQLGRVIADLENGWSPKCMDRPAENDEWGVLKLGAISFGRYNEAENKALPSTLIPAARFEVKTGDVLFVRGNVLRLVGACSYVDATRPKLMMPDLMFRAVFKSGGLIEARFLAEVMRLPHLRQQIESVATGTSPTMKKVSKPSLLGLRIPLPPLAIQNQLVAEVTAAREAIAAERAAVAKLAADTSREVEEMILGHRPVPNFT